MAQFFLSYRVASAAAHAGRLFDRLAARFGHRSIFFDRGKLEPGAQWEIRLFEELSRAAAVVAVIDPGWATSFAERSGGQYYVRFEIEKALELAKPIIPVLVAKCQLPTESDLPLGIRPVLGFQAVQVDDSSSAIYEAAIKQLISSLEAVFDSTTDQNDIVRLLGESQFTAARRLLADLPETAIRKEPKFSCYLALARLEGRSFNGLYPAEREEIEGLLREAYRALPAWGLPALLLAVLEIDFYQLSGRKSKDPVRPAEVLQILDRAPLNAIDRSLLVSVLISKRARASLPRF
jgi:hypothetical protein